MIYVLAFALLLLSPSQQEETHKCQKRSTFYSLEEALENPDQVFVLDLAMQDPKLTAIPEEVLQFENLECLDVSFNRVGSLPNGLKDLKHLKHVNLAGNRYLAKFPDVLLSIEKLEVVDFTAIPEWSEEKCAHAKAQLPNVDVRTDCNSEETTE